MNGEVEASIPQRFDGLLHKLEARSNTLVAGWAVVVAASLL